MKKFKKILSAVSAAVLCSLPMMNGVAVNAAEDKTVYRAYVLYHDIINPSAAYFDFSIGYDPSVVAEPSMKTALCGTNNFNSIHYTTSHKIQTTYSGKAFGRTGTAATTKLLIPMSSNVYDLITYEKPVIKNVNGSNLSPTSLTLDAVLLGDVNGDGLLGIADAAYLNKYLIDPSGFPLEDFRAADVDLDGMITENDKEILMQYCLGVLEHL